METIIKEAMMGRGLREGNRGICGVWKQLTLKGRNKEEEEKTIV